MKNLRPDAREKYLSLQKKVDTALESSSNINAEEILGKYLYEIGKKVNEDFYQTIIVFSRLCKECLNEYGWGLVNKTRSVTMDERRKEFSKQSNSADYIPDISNDFINYYLPEKFPTFDKYLATELVRHLCNWIQKNGYSKKIVKLI